MSAPTIIDITHQYLEPDGVTPGSGSVSFTPRQPITVGGVTFARDPTVAVLDGTGSISVSLVATDNSDNPSNTYIVSEELSGDPSRRYVYDIIVLHANLTADLNAFQKIGTPPSINIPVPGPQGDPGPTGPSGNINVVYTYTALRALTSGSYARAQLQGASTTLTGIAGDFIWDHDSTQPDDGGIYIRPSDVANDGLPGRWVRQRRYADEYNPDWWGATTGAGKSTGTKTATVTAMNTAADLAHTNKGTLIISGYYEINGTVNIRSNIHATNAEFHVNDNFITRAVLFGKDTWTGTADSTVGLREVFLPAVVQDAKPATGWTGTSVGVELTNAESCVIWVNTIDSFVDGLVESAKGDDGHGQGYGFQHNEIHIGYLRNDKRSQVLQPRTSANWVNENKHYGARMYHASTEGTNVSGTRKIVCGDAVIAPNHNIWYSPSIEGNVAEYMWECYGTDNVIDEARFETTGTPRVWYRSGTTVALRNKVRGGDMAQSIVYTEEGTGLSTSFLNQHDDGYHIVRSSLDDITGFAAGELSRAPFTGANFTNSGVSYVFMVEEPARGTVLGQKTSRWQAVIGHITSMFKNAADTQPRLQFNYSSVPIMLMGPGGTTAPDLNLYRDVADRWRTDDQLYAADGIATRPMVPGAGVPITDAIWTGATPAKPAPLNATIVVDQSNSRLAVKVGTAWKYVTLT